MRKVLVEMTEKEAIAFLSGKGGKTATGKKGTKEPDEEEEEEDEDLDLGLEEEEEEEGGEDEVTMEMIQTKCQKLGKAGKMAKIKALMTKMKVPGVSKLKESQYEKFYQGLMAIK